MLRRVAVLRIILRAQNHDIPSRLKLTTDRHEAVKEWQQP